MQLRRTPLFLAILAAAALTLVPPGSEGSAEARNSGDSVDSGAKSSSKRVKSAGAKGKKGKASRRKRRRGKRSFSGHAVKSKLRAAPLEKPSGDVWIVSENLKEEIRVNIYDESGEFDEEALARLDHEFRCRRTKEERAVDPRLYETLSRIQDHFEGKRVHLVSGFRFQRNEGSRHYHASAMDIRIPGVNNRQLRKFAESLDGGGMGIGLYPKSGFVHVDFRAPGQPSYRWVDRSGPGKGGSKGKRRSRRAKRRTPNT